MAISEDQAKAIAIDAFVRAGGGIRQGPIKCMWFDRISVADPVAVPGWVVVIPLNVPEGVDPDTAFVEVRYETGECRIPPII